jgi:hypothetical protein
MGVKNRLSDLNDHLFAQIERLGDEDMTKEELDTEIKRAEAITPVAQAIIANAALVLKAHVLKAESIAFNEPLPRMLTDGSRTDESNG